MGLNQTVKVYRIPSGANNAAPQADRARSARRFGTWTLLSSIVRLYAVSQMENRGLYVLALWTYVIAGAHFVVEWLVFGDQPTVRALAVAGVSMVWMVAQWNFYVQA